MNTHRSARLLLTSAAIAGMLGGTAVRLQAIQINSDTTVSAGQLADNSDAGKHSCKGKNTCKGQGGCKAGDNGCKAKNSCKGKGGCATDGSKS
jgi:hypothetical protein